jgi:hypothetical protein
MAELILTEAEKQTATYLDWDDAALGKAVKKLALLMGEIRGNEALACTSGAVLLACQAAKQPDGVLTIQLDGITDGYDRVGDWQLVVSRLTGEGTGHSVGDPNNRRTRR